MADQFSPTILVVDNEKRWRDLLSIKLSEAGYEVHTCGSEKNRETACMKALSETRTDLVVMDVRLYRTIDDADISGLNLAQEIRRNYPDIAIVIKTAYSVGAELDRWIKRHAQLLEGVADAFLLQSPTLESDLSIGRNSGADVVAVARTLFEKKVRTNFGCELAWDGLKPADVIATFKDRLAKQKLLTVEDEVCLLLRKLYYEPGGGPTRIRIAPLVPGVSKAAVVLVEPFHGAERRASEVVKMDLRARVERELDNFRKYVRGRVGGRRAPHEEREAFTTRLGGFALTNLGIEPGELQEFGTYYDENKFEHPELIRAAISDLFEQTCKLWYQTPRTVEKPTDQWLAEEFSQWESKFLEGVELSRARRGVDGRLSFRDLPDISFANPIDLLSLVMAGKLEQSYSETVTHGDLNSRNLLVDKHQQTWLIDFYQTRPSHVLRDLCRLETTILFERIVSENLAALVQFTAGLASASHLDQEIEVAVNLSQFPEMDAALEAICHIRGLAGTAQGLGRGIADYYTIVACDALKYASFENVAAVRRKHALAYASQLLTRVSLL
jgi:CheY-like chemotaxis protein